jgi:MraZ protein
MTWRGRAHIKIDPKGRMSLPTSFRDGLNSSQKVFITNNFYQGHRFLDFFTQAEWEKLEKKISKMPNLKTEVQVFRRFYLSSVETCDIDAQGRLLIPSHLRDYAQLQDDIVLVGMGQKIEISQEEEWQKLLGSLEKDFEKVTDVISNLDESGSMGRGNKK